MKHRVSDLYAQVLRCFQQTKILLKETLHLTETQHSLKRLLHKEPKIRKTIFGLTY